MNNKDLASKTFVRFGGVPLLNTFWGKSRLTVLAYHRIVEHNRPDFADYRQVASATPGTFERQLDYIAKHFNVIRMADLHAALTEDAPLPDYPLLITFDDGYLDNYENAYPLLRQYDLPATIFLTTDCMDHPATPLWWDEVARAFHRTAHRSASLPLIGKVDLSSGGRERTLDHLLSALKRLTKRGRQDAVRQICETLEVGTEPGEPSFVTWEQIREMIRDGIELGAHTVSHPILTRVSEEEAKHEIIASRDAIREHTGITTTAFAYPNGTDEDDSPAVMRHLQDAGFDMAFTLAPGPMRWGEATAHPLQIRRVYLSYKDTYEIFTAKIMGLPALGQSIAYPAAR